MLEHVRDLVTGSQCTDRETTGTPSRETTQSGSKASTIESGRKHRTSPVKSLGQVICAHVGKRVTKPARRDRGQTYCLRTQAHMA